MMAPEATVLIKKVRHTEDPVYPFGSSGKEDVERLQSQLLKAIQSGRKFVRVDVDQLPELDNAGSRALIRTLRIVRNAGGEIILRVTRADLRHTLKSLALDKVFATE
jgi:anti-anti-sigma regulatory factor